MKGELIERKAVMDWLREKQTKAIIQSNEPMFHEKGIVSQRLINAAIDFIILLPTEGNVNRQKDLHHYIGIASKHELLVLKEMIEKQLEKCE